MSSTLESTLDEGQHKRAICRCDNGYETCTSNGNTCGGCPRYSTAIARRCTSSLCAPMAGGDAVRGPPAPASIGAGVRPRPDPRGRAPDVAAADRRELRRRPGRSRVPGADFAPAIFRAPRPGRCPAFGGTGGVWECDPLVWPHVATVSFAGQAVAVVPLETQLETNIAGSWAFSGESLQGRTEEMVRMLRERGYDRSLFEWAARPEHLARFDEVPGEHRRG